MKNYLGTSIRLTLIMILLLAVLYPLVIAGIGLLSVGRGKGETVSLHGKVVGYALIGQQFSADKYFWGRPSAIQYNAAGSGGSNKGPGNPDYLKIVQDRIDTFLVHNPGVKKSQLPADLVTASGSGLDPDISPAAAEIQIKRVALHRGMAEETVRKIVARHTVEPFLGLFGPRKVNVLDLNISLDTSSSVQ